MLSEVHFSSVVCSNITLYLFTRIKFTVQIVYFQNTEKPVHNRFLTVTEGKILGISKMLCLCIQNIIIFTISRSNFMCVCFFLYTYFIIFVSTLQTKHRHKFNHTFKPTMHSAFNELVTMWLWYTNEIRMVLLFFHGNDNSTGKFSMKSNTYIHSKCKNQIRKLS